MQIIAAAPDAQVQDATRRRSGAVPVAARPAGERSDCRGECQRQRQRGRAGEERFARGFEPVRVLEPLVAILAMAGMIGGEPAGRVGT
ncbi:hypothetical protein AB0L13_05120 [Saccharopolyspora shandongensis]|uniref:hypothetical protein n=1 Tax=Saccharopolyspora shandongensis TaxID=418495 RepID=UPI0034253CD2